ncbi:hypothetical protein GV764_06940 [Atlantibacter hermannii]|nr:hypothetical protein [Atlantibacter hermannii]NBC98755.1 hypothetical protein [Atlantibacter hermannii]
MQKFFVGLYILLINILSFSLVIFTIYIILTFFANIKRNSELIAVQWCDVFHQHALWENQYRGVYIYMEDADDGGVNIKGQLFNGRNYSIWNSYRLYFTDIIAKEKNAQKAREKWSKVTCLGNGEALVGDAQYLIH